MKIKNVALSLAGCMAVAMCVGKIGALAVDQGLDLSMDVKHAIQHIKNVRIIGGDSPSILKYAGSKLVGIQTNNFVISMTGDGVINQIGSNTKYSNILGGRNNKIGNNNKSSTILGGESNNNQGSYSTILGGKLNEIQGGSYSVIIGGNSSNDNNDSSKKNKLNGNYSVVIGDNNEVQGKYSVALGAQAKVQGDNSVALGKNSKITNNTNNSFLWTDGDTSRGELKQSNVFAVNSKNGMVVNATAPHSLAQLTIGGPLVVSKDGYVECEDSDAHKGVVKAVDGGNGRVCICSCDGKGYWHSLYGQGNCEGKCNATEKEPDCGNKFGICNGEYLGACVNSRPLPGQDAYVVDSAGVVHWICQTDAGKSKACSSATMAGAGDNACSWYSN